MRFLENVTEYLHDLGLGKKKKGFLKDTKNSNYKVYSFDQIKTLNLCSTKTTLLEENVFAIYVKTAKNLYTDQIINNYKWIRKNNKNKQDLNTSQKIKLKSNKC